MIRPAVHYRDSATWIAAVLDYTAARRSGVTAVATEACASGFIPPLNERGGVGGRYRTRSLSLRASTCIRAPILLSLVKTPT